MLTGTSSIGWLSTDVIVPVRLAEWLLSSDCAIVIKGRHSKNMTKILIIRMVFILKKIESRIGKKEAVTKKKQPVT